MFLLKDYNFELPKKLIAQTPNIIPEESKLLEIYSNKYIDHKFINILNLITPKDLLIVNNTKVIKSKIKAHYKGNNFIITLCKALPNGNWLAFVNKAKKLDIRSILNLPNNYVLEIINKNPTTGEIEVCFKNISNIYSYLDTYGFMPLPPYIKRKDINDSNDTKYYQSIFAKYKGAVAAPTASLHFTHEILNKITNKGIKVAQVTLHVGPGTFLPVKTPYIKDHHMHSEYGEIPEKTAKLIHDTKKNGGNIIAVGTTTLRILEHVAQNYSNIVPFKGHTNIFIYPGFVFKVVDKLITNFHTPKSTLFMLVCAFAGIDNMKKAYTHAIKHNYKFFSYGDCTFLHKINN